MNMYMFEADGRPRTDPGAAPPRLRRGPHAADCRGLSRDPPAVPGEARAGKPLAPPRFLPLVERRRVFVSGTVQGVFFRESTREEADRHGVAGWVRNVPDGRVEAVFEGPREAVEALVAWCRRGPPRARVEEVSAQAEEPRGERPPFQVLREGRR